MNRTTTQNKRRTALIILFAMFASWIALGSLPKSAEADYFLQTIPTSTPCGPPVIHATTGTINVRSGPGTAYEIISGVIFRDVKTNHRAGGVCDLVDDRPE